MSWLDYEAGLLHTYAVNFNRVGVTYRKYDPCPELLVRVACRWMKDRPDGFVQVVTPSHIQATLFTRLLLAAVPSTMSLLFNAQRNQVTRADGSVIFRAVRDTPSAYQGLHNPDMLLIGYCAEDLSQEFYTVAEHNKRGSNIVAGFPRADHPGHARFKEFCQSTHAYRTYSTDPEYVARYGDVWLWSELHGRWPADVDE